MRDYMIRQHLAALDRAAALCECGHANGDHRELERDTIDIEASLAAGSIIATPNPDYRALHFHCHADGCDCIKILS